MNQPLADLIRRHLVAENAQDLAGPLATLHPGADPIPALAVLQHRAAA